MSKAGTLQQLHPTASFGVQDCGPHETIEDPGDARCRCDTAGGRPTLAADPIATCSGVWTGETASDTTRPTQALNIPATSIAVEALFYPEADFDDFREGRRDSFVHAPNVSLNAQKSHRFAEAFVARWLRQTRGATVWAGTVSFFGPVTKRHVCTKDVLDRLSSDCGRERVERLRVSSPRLVTPDVVVRLPNGSWQFIEVKRATDWPPRDEQLRALAYLQWLRLGCVSVVRLLPEGQTYSGPTAIDVKPFSVSLDPDAPSVAL